MNPVEELVNSVSGDTPPDTHYDVTQKMNRLLTLRSMVVELENAKLELSQLERELSAIINPKPVRVPKVSRKRKVRTVTTTSSVGAPE